MCDGVFGGMEQAVTSWMRGCETTLCSIAVGLALLFLGVIFLRGVVVVWSSRNL
jgi:hypothetical protein